MKTLLICLLILLYAGPFLAQENVPVKKVKFKGNRTFNNLRLKEQTVLQSSSLISRKLLKKDQYFYSEEAFLSDVETLTNFYHREGYLNFSCASPIIEINHKDKVTLTFLVDEGEPIKVEAIHYLVDSTKTLPDYLTKSAIRRIRLDAQLKVNEVFNDERFLADRDYLNEQFRRIGYAYVHTEYRLQQIP